MGHLQNHLAEQGFSEADGAMRHFLCCCVAVYGQQASGCKQAEKQALRASEGSNDVQLIKG